MEDKKKKLMNALNIAISALKNNTIHYDWKHQDSCNCGVVAQAVLGKSKVEIDKLWNESMKTRVKLNREDEKVDPTWQDSVKHLCPMTGEPLTEVFKQLFAAGLSKEDIVHLEFMDNKAILDNSRISKKDIVIQTTKKSVIINEREIPHPFLLLRMLGITKTEKFEVDDEKLITTTSKYYTSKENLILYLTSWLNILKSGAKYKSEDNINNLRLSELESELLNAVSEEKFEYASQLRDQINLTAKK